MELTDILLSMHNDPDFEAFNMSRLLPECLAPVFTIRVSSKDRVWLIKRSYEDFRVLDKRLHSCIYDRRYSQLVELPKGIPLSQNIVAVRAMLSHYLSRFSQIAGDMINCGPVLNWMEMENHGNHVIANDESAINIPAVAAAHVIKRYAAQAPDEISLEVGDMISVIDMPPQEEASWWRGKNGFDVGFFNFFPSQCIDLIGENLPPAVAERVGKTPKPVLRKQGKLILFLRSFILARPTKRGLKERGILRERVFSCDLGEHLLNSGSDIPLVIKACTEFIEEYGVVDGIYRQSGVASNVQKLRDDFDCDILPDLTLYQKDVHCVSSVCKLYFRELPNPLLTYQLYRNFEDIEVGSCAAFLEIKVQATVVEFLIRNVDIIFNNKLLPEGIETETDPQLRPKSMVLSAPTKLLSLEEARARSATIAEGEEKPKYIEVGGGPSALPKQYHTVIDLPYDRKHLTTKSRKSAVWRAFFTKKEGKRKGAQVKKGKKGANLRSARSEESLSSTEAHLNKKADDETDKGVVYRRSRSSSVVESVYRTSSHDSFFELDPGVVAAATRDFIESTATAQRAKLQEDRSSSRDGSKDDRSSPQWIDQSISSADSETPSSLPRDSCAFTSPIVEWDDETEQSTDLQVAAATAPAEPPPPTLSLTPSDPLRSEVKRRNEVPRRRNVEVQTPVGEEFPRDPTSAFLNLNGSGLPAVYFNLDDAVLGSATPRKSALFRSPDVTSPASPRYSLDAVMSEYDQLMERYGTQEVSPDFAMSCDSLAAASATLPATFSQTPTGRTAPIASADSTSSTDLTPAPPPRRESRATPSDSPSTPTGDPFTSPSTPPLSEMSPIPPPRIESRATPSNSPSTPTGGPATPPSSPSRGLSKDELDLSLYSSGGDILNRHSPADAAVGGLYSVDASDIHIETVTEYDSSPVLSTGTDLTGDTLQDEPLQVTSIDDVVLQDPQNSGGDRLSSELDSVESSCNAVMDNLSLDRQVRDAPITNIPFQEEDIRKCAGPDRPSEEGMEQEALEARRTHEREGRETRNVFSGVEVGQKGVGRGEGKLGEAEGDVFSVDEGRNDMEYEEAATPSRTQPDGKGEESSGDDQGRGNQEGFSGRNGEDLGVERKDSQERERVMRGDLERGSQGEGLRGEGSYSGGSGDVAASGEEDEEQMHALPGETIIISDIIEL